MEDMDIDELIMQLEEATKELKDLRESLIYTGAEIHMWREKYLSSLPLEKTSEKESYVRSSFLFFPSQYMMIKSPEEHIYLLRKGFTDENSTS